MADSNEAQRVKDFDRLYERLVARKRPAANRKSKKKLKKLRKPSAAEEAAAPRKPPPQANDSKLPCVQKPVAADRTDSDACQKQPTAVATSTVTRDGEEGRESDALTPQPVQDPPELDAEPEPEPTRHVYDAIARLRLGRNFRVFARVYSRRPRRLSAQITSASTAKTFQQFVKAYRAFRDRGSTLQELRCRGLHRHRMLGCVRLEEVAARLFRRRANDFYADKTTRTCVDGRHRLMEELRFFSPPHSGFQSLIGYAEAGNAVALPPARVVRVRRRGKKTIGLEDAG